MDWLKATLDPNASFSADTGRRWITVQHAQAAINVLEEQARQPNRSRRRLTDFDFAAKLASSEIQKVVNWMCDHPAFVPLTVTFAGVGDESKRPAIREWQRQIVRATGTYAAFDRSSPDRPGSSVASVTGYDSGEMIDSMAADVVVRPKEPLLLPAPAPAPVKAKKTELAFKIFRGCESKQEIDAQWDRYAKVRYRTGYVNRQIDWLVGMGSVEGEVAAILKVAEISQPGRAAVAVPFFDSRRRVERLKSISQGCLASARWSHKASPEEVAALGFEIRSQLLSSFLHLKRLFAEEAARVESDIKEKNRLYFAVGAIVCVPPAD